MPNNPDQPPQGVNAYIPPGPRPLLFEDFQGMNLSTTRPGVPDNQAYWLDGFFPIDKRNLRTLYGVGTVLYTRTASLTIVMFNFYNIGATPYMVVFLSDGSAVQVNTSSGATTEILPAGTITTPTITNIGTSQWGSQYLIIVANQTNGYWLWNGSTLFKAGTLNPIVVLTSAGGNYISQPTITAVGGSGFGASFSATISSGFVTGVNVLNPGQGWFANESVTLVFTGGTASGSNATLTGSVGTSLTLISVSIVSAGSNYGNPTATVYPNSSTSVVRPLIRLFVASPPGPITSVSIVNPGTLAGIASIVVTDAGTLDASASIEIMPFGIQGTAVETYQGRVWVANLATVYFTAPGSITDFSTNNGGGNFTSNDSFLRVGFVQLIQTNGFLYLIADSSVNYISGVQTTGNPPTTTFTNQNADPQVGTPYPASVETFGRNILFANSFGIHVIAGAAANKVSDELDGVYTSVANFGALQLSSSQAILFGRKVWMTLSKIVNPVTGVTENKLFMWNGKQWWASSQDIELNYIRHQEINSVITAYGTNGTVVRPLFATASSGFTKTLQSRLWDAPGGYQLTKGANRLWGVAQYFSTVSPNLLVSIDNENGTMSTLTTIVGPSSVALGNYFVFPPQAIGQVGVLTGLTLRTTAADMSMISMMMQDEIVQYRG